jgi:hypothetical protein
LFAVQVLPIIAALPQLTLLGSMHPPYRHWVPAAEQVVPHVPQFFGSLFMSTQTPLHTDWPVGHVQTPLTHDAPVAHGVQPPQCWTLEFVSMHAELVPQGPSPTGQWQAPI